MYELSKGWAGGDQKVPSIFLKIGHSNKQDVLIPNLVSKIVYGFKIKSYEQIKFEILRSISGAEISLKKWWSQKTSPRGLNWGKFKKKKISKKRDFRTKNMKKTKSPKMTSKVLCELLIRSYERFKYFSRTWNLTISKSTSVNQR